jgi:hypothetical protein
MPPDPKTTKDLNIEHVLAGYDVIPDNKTSLRARFRRLRKKITTWLVDAGLLYDTPSALPWEEWEQWEDHVSREYPFQHCIRKSFQLITSRCYRYWDDAYMKVYRVFKPAHPIVRKALPREWCDISGLIVDVNFAFILQFKKEADESCVDWDAQEGHTTFKAWLDASAEWIKVTLPALNKELDGAYPPFKGFNSINDDIPYEVKYAEVIRISKLIEDGTTDILKKLMEYRKYMWT